MNILEKRYGELYLHLQDQIERGKRRSPECQKQDEKLLDELEQRIDRETLHKAA
jgi:hypothetical protein